MDAGNCSKNANQITMPKINHVIVSNPPKPTRKYSDAELKKFNDLAQKYYENYTIQFGPTAGEVIRVLNREKLSQAYGATSKKGAVILEDVFESKEGLDYKKPTRLEQLDNLLEQWMWWKQRMGYGDVKKIEGLEKMAEEKHVEPIEFEF